jgi:hypothetical protein
VQRNTSKPTRLLLKAFKGAENRRSELTDPGLRHPHTRVLLEAFRQLRAQVSAFCRSSITHQCSPHHRLLLANGARARDYFEGAC